MLFRIEFVSKALSKAQKKQAIPFLECCVIVLGLKKFECYVHGAHVDIFTDHYGLQNMKKNNPPAQIQRLWWDIADHDFDIYYKKGKQTSQIPKVDKCLRVSLKMRDMKLLNKIDVKVRKHAKFVEVLE